MRKKMTEEEKLVLRERIKVARENKVPKIEKILQVTKEYRIVSDTLQYILQKKNEKGNWVLVGYHSKIWSVIESLGEHTVKDDLDSLLFVSRQLEGIKKIVSDYENLREVEIKTKKP